jgi:hypothetical protein
MVEQRNELDPGELFVTCSHCAKRAQAIDALPRFGGPFELKTPSEWMAVMEAI